MVQSAGAPAILQPGSRLHRTSEVSYGSFSSDQPAPDALGMSAAPPIAPKIVHCSDSTKSAKSGCEQSQQGSSYSITSSAATSSAGGTVRPSAFSGLMLMIVWYL